MQIIYCKGLTPRYLTREMTAATKITAALKATFELPAPAAFEMEMACPVAPQDLWWDDASYARYQTEGCDYVPEPTIAETVEDAVWLASNLAAKAASHHARTLAAANTIAAGILF